MNSIAPKKILIVRTDRIGDVVLSLPMIDLLRRTFPDARISFLAQDYTAKLLVGYPGLDQLLLYREGVSQKRFWRILGELRLASFDTVVVAHPTFRIALLVFLAGIPIRIGTGYRWYSFLFNRRVFEHRKTAERHEAEYNLSLLRVLGCDVALSPRPILPLQNAVAARVDEIRARHGLSGNEAIIVLHPGSGGSARDWPPERFGELAARLSEAGFQVVMTGSRGEEHLVQNVVAASGNRAISLAGEFSLDELAWFLRGARLVVSNSTGPLHITAALGVPVVAFYPPILACSSRRWGPLASDKVIFEPRAEDCPRCKGGSCRGDDCMRLIAVDDVFRASIQLLSRVTNKTGQVP